MKLLLFCVIYTALSFKLHGNSSYEEFLKILERKVAKKTYDLRKLKFMNTLRTIAQFEQNNPYSTFNLSVNEFSDWFDWEIALLFSENFDSNVDPSKSNIDNNVLMGEGSPEYITTIPTEYNWDSNKNRLGLPIWCGENQPVKRNFFGIAEGNGAVHNQGLCGACWAFVAAASVEASVRISENRQVSVSVQELVDCDNVFNHGCHGGNPIGAFNYIMNFGISLASDYPYVEMEHDICLNNVRDPKVAISRFVRVPTMSENLILRYLVNNGPIATGICGTDFSFLYYSGGVYSVKGCCLEQNHAVLIVGYGHDNHTGLDYWLIRNSWGLHWGEDGYMRIVRNTSVFGEGQCGLAMNPSVPLGGYTIGLPADANICEGQQYYSADDSLLSVMKFYAYANWQLVGLLGLTSLSLLVWFLIETCCCQSRSYGELYEYEDYNFNEWDRASLRSEHNVLQFQAESTLLLSHTHTAGVSPREVACVGNIVPQVSTVVEQHSELLSSSPPHFPSPASSNVFTSPTRIPSYGSIPKKGVGSPRMNTRQAPPSPLMRG